MHLMIITLDLIGSDKICVQMKYTTENIKFLL